jgi:hypothetical protein
LELNTVRSVSIAVCAAVCVALAATSNALAGGRYSSKATMTGAGYSPAAAGSGYSTPATSSSARADDAKYERKCVIMSCGTPWCYNTRVK